jgi:cytochrome P450
VIPKNAIVVGILASSHLDPENFSQPYEFRPERFIDEVTGKISKKDHLIPFSIGECQVFLLPDFHCFSA